MPRPILSVIGGLSIDNIQLINELPEAGQMVSAEEFVELGGRAANIAIAATRSCHPKPPTDDGLLPDTPHEYNSSSYFSGYSGNNSSTPEVRIIAAAASNLHDEFNSLFRRNGVITSGLANFRGTQSKVFSWVQRDSRRARQTVVGGVEQFWTPSNFNTPEKLGNGEVPDLVVVTMELKKEVVEEIIRTAHAANIEVIVYGSPAASLLNELYPMITHIILNEGDAGVIMGYPRGYVTIDNWHEICEDFHGVMSVPNVVLKLGPYGAYYKNESEEGYAGGFTRLPEIADTTGSTAAFVGAYAMHRLQQKYHDNPWSISEACTFGNKVCAFCVVDIGCVNATPWANDLESFDEEPLFRDMEELRVEMRRTAGRG